MPRIKRDDTVMVITGKDAGRVGRVLRIAKGGERVVVEKLNMAKRHQRPTQANPQGGIIDKEMGMHISNVMLLTKENQPVRVGYETRDVDGKTSKIRVAKQTGEPIE